MSVFRANALALITGGSSGIGFAVAQLCLKHGMRVGVVDINKDTLEYAKAQLQGKDSDVEIFQADVSKEDEWKTLKGKVETRFGSPVDFLMLNAGVQVKGTWGDDAYFDKTLAVNLFGVIHGLNTYVPSFKSQTSNSPSAIVVTGSKQGITNPPGNAAYNASKSAVKTLTEHLSFDLKDTKTSVHLLVPGWTFTGLSGNAPGSASTKPNGAWHASQVADYMYSKIAANKFYILCPDDDVSEDLDKKRMLWTAGDLVNGRPPLTRWREDWKDEAQGWIQGADPELLK
ncbi:NAD(P)-binding protein [Aaosphaeria arxii CBS 175.79]|uniref:NAD(P)-binding protein n=1 Tax=Aaosphaeria arxii CBS 175.79 TaxID=1450172 RepID=A0A6A5X955_9PLEO|nr:NAD(P)-binding protein [Aaosphaeria arxii CBS 175.79]KAF2009461.1 NAD(P)-binding protein [Aaosphaeria arxii CBS 175.79]